MAKSNRRIRERRLARRLGTTAASAEASASSGRPLVRHTARCRCAGCQKREDDRIKDGIPDTRRRLRGYRPGHSCPEHREGWRISPERLSDFLKTHEEMRDRRGRLTHVDMRPRWLDHLDGLLVQHALQEMQECKPYWNWLIVTCVVDGNTQTQVAEWLGVSQCTISRQLNGALRHLRELLCPNRDREADQAGGAA
jgi:hypothetical protein